MKRSRTEITIITQKQLEEIAKQVARGQIIGSIFFGEFGEQSTIWNANGGIEVRTTYTQADWSDLVK